VLERIENSKSKIEKEERELPAFLSIFNFQFSISPTPEATCA